jgi:GNAT superfamily N-acetyltransferase
MLEHVEPKGAGLDESDGVESNGNVVMVTRTYLHLLAPGDLKRSGPPNQSVQVEEVKQCSPAFYRYLYAEVGRNYHWTDRLPWDDEQIGRHLARTEILIWVMYDGGSPAGYFELEIHEDGSTEIAYFGLLENCIGRGLGKYLLSEAVDKAWATGASKVWLHTCTLDDIAAMPNYLKRGFTPFKQETYSTTLSAAEMRRFQQRPHTLP